MRIIRKLKRLGGPIVQKYYVRRRAVTAAGSKNWLIQTEFKYGGLVTNVARRRVSPNDPRSQSQLDRGGMTGGDRMFHHGYAAKYAAYLRPYVESGRAVTLAEIGILRGTGLAIWCDLFTGARILGFDIDLSHVHENMSNLKNLGAFRRNQPEVYEFDQFKNNIDLLGGILAGSKIDICIDDGFHSTESILSTMRSVMPYLAEDAVYFIEDNKDVHEVIASLYPGLVVDHKGEFTVVTRVPALARRS